MRRVTAVVAGAVAIAGGPPAGTAHAATTAPQCRGLRRVRGNFARLWRTAIDRMPLGGHVTER